VSDDMVKGFQREFPLVGSGGEVNKPLSLRAQRGNLCVAIPTYLSVIAVNRSFEWSEGAARQSQPTGLLVGCGVKGVQREFHLLGVWGYPPAIKIPQDWGI
jgi:hypothetical protein